MHPKSFLDPVVNRLRSSSFLIYASRTLINSGSGLHIGYEGLVKVYQSKEVE